MQVTGIKKVMLGVLLCSLMLSLLILVPFIPHSVSKIVQAQFLAEAEQSQLLVTFGYPGCGELCPLNLQKLAEIADENENKKLGLVFINFNLYSTKESLHKYVKSFHPKLKAFQPTEIELQSLRSDFGINPIEAQDQFDHAGKIYFVKKSHDKWKIQKAYPAVGFSFNMLH